MCISVMGRFELEQRWRHDDDCVCFAKHLEFFGTRIAALRFGRVTVAAVLIDDVIHRLLYLEFTDVIGHVRSGIPDNRKAAGSCPCDKGDDGEKNPNAQIFEWGPARHRQPPWPVNHGNARRVATNEAAAAAAHQMTNICWRFDVVHVIVLSESAHQLMPVTP